MLKTLFLLAVGAIICGGSLSASAASNVIPQEAYERAVQRLQSSYRTFEGKTVGSSSWLDDNRLAFSLEDGKGWEAYYLYDAANGKITDSDASIMPKGPGGWPGGFDVGGSFIPKEVISPDGRWAISRQDYNLVVKDIKSGEVRQLTDDAAEDYQYGDSLLMAWSGQIGAKLLGLEPGPSLSWSPDSKRFLTFAADARGVRRKSYVGVEEKDGGLIDYTRYDAIQPMAGDKNLTTARFAIFNPSTGTRVDIATPIPYQHASDPLGDGTFWSADGQYVYLAYSDVIERNYSIYRVNATTGEVDEILAEKGYFIGHWSHMAPQVHGNDLIVMSYRDGYRRLYRHDAVSGEVQNMITNGSIYVNWMLGVSDGWVYFSAGELKDGIDPHQYQLFRARLDGSRQERLTDGKADYSVNPSSDFSHFLVTRKVMDKPDSYVIIDNTGKQLTSLATPELRQGVPLPERVMGVGRDGKTEIWGTLFKPSDFDPSKKYPIVNWVHGTVGFIWSPTSLDDGQNRRWQALAELGFLVLAVDGMGGVGRTESFLKVAHDTGHQCGGILENVLMTRQLAEKRPYVDVNRVGVAGYSQGGNCSSRAILEYPDDFHVAVSQSGNHDSRFNHVGEIYGYIGWPEDNPEKFIAQDNASLAHQLKGKILFTHGVLDDDVPLVTTYHVIEELIKHNKQYDLMVMPSERHTNSGHPYHLRVVWSYFAEHLLGKKLKVFDN